MSPSSKDSNIRTLSPAQAEIMEIVWQRGEVSAREVRMALNESDARDLSRSTVRTLMERMREKGWLNHRLCDRTYLYSATQPKKQRLTQKVREVIETLCDGRPEALVATLLDDRCISREGLQSIREMLNDAEQRMSDSTETPGKQQKHATKRSAKQNEQPTRAKKPKRRPRST